MESDEKLLLEKEVDIYSTEFYESNSGVGCVYVTHNKVVENKFEFSGDHWKKTDHNVTHTNNIGLFTIDPKIRLSEKYVALLVSRENTEYSNILIWKRN